MPVCYNHASMMICKKIISTITAAAAAVALFTVSVPVALAGSDNASRKAITSSRSFPKMNTARKDLLKETVSVSSDDSESWGGVESLNVPETKSTAEKKAEEEAKKAEAWEKLHEGDVVKGVVRRLTNFGAFVDIGGVDGLVHVTDLSWHRVGHPSEVVSVGQEIDVKIIKLDPERGRISLSYKATQPKPWDVAGEKYQAGDIVTGKVVRIVPYGAFVELEPGLDGMVHISQCALKRIDKVEDAVNVGDEIRVKILKVDTDAKRISLSIREALTDEAMETPSDALDVFNMDAPEA